MQYRIDWLRFRSKYTIKSVVAHLDRLQYPFLVECVRDDRIGREFDRLRALRDDDDSVDALPPIDQDRFACRDFVRLTHC